MVLWHLVFLCINNYEWEVLLQIKDNLINFQQWFPKLTQNDRVVSWHFIPAFPYFLSGVPFRFYSLGFFDWRSQATSCRNHQCIATTNLLLQDFGLLDGRVIQVHQGFRHQQPCPFRMVRIGNLNGYTTQAAPTLPFIRESGLRTYWTTTILMLGGQLTKHRHLLAQMGFQILYVRSISVEESLPRLNL